MESPTPFRTVPSDETLKNHPSSTWMLLAPTRQRRSGERRRKPFIDRILNGQALKHRRSWANLQEWNSLRSSRPPCSQVKQGQKVAFTPTSGVCPVRRPTELEQNLALRVIAVLNGISVSSACGIVGAVAIWCVIVGVDRQEVSVNERHVHGLGATVRRQGIVCWQASLNIG